MFCVARLVTGVGLWGGDLAHSATSDRIHGRFTIPVAQLPARGDEGFDAAGVEGDVSLVDEVGEPGSSEQFRRRFDVSDDLAVGVGVGDEVFGGGIPGEGGRAFGGGQDGSLRRRGPTVRRRRSGSRARGCRRSG